MAVGDVLEVVVDYHVREEPCAQVLHYREAVGSVDTIPAASLARAVEATIIPDWALLLSNEVTMNCIYARRIRPTPDIAFTVLLTTIGGEASESIPTTSALLMSLLSAVASKRGRGRSYFAGLPENAQAGGSLEGGVLASWQSFGDLLLTNLVAVGGDTGEWMIGVYSRADVAIHDCVAQVVRTNLATQRGRRQRPGTS